MNATGTNSFSGGMLVNLLLIIGGTIAVVWFSTLTSGDRQVFIDHGLRITTLILALPGVFWTAKIAANQNMPWQRRCVLGSIVVLGFCIALPMAVEWKLEQLAPAFLSNFERVFAPH